MKREHWIILILLILLGYAGYRGIVAPKDIVAPDDVVAHHNLQIEEPEILLLANPGLNSLGPQNSHQCDPGDAPGCVRFYRDFLGTITFQIQAGPRDTTCSGTPPPQWVITEVELTADATSPGSGKGDYTQPIPDWLTNAFPQTNSLTGVAYQADLNFATSSAVIIDLNNHDHNEGQKTIYYKVTAKNCAGSTTLVTDPMVRNDGR